MAREPILSVVIPTRDTRPLILACLTSLQRQQGVPREVLVVDDASTDDTQGAVTDRFPEVRLVRNEESRGYSASINRGLAEASAEFLLLLNSDTEIEAEALRRALELLGRRERIGILGAQLVFPDGKDQWSGGHEPSLAWLFLLSSHLARASRRRSAIYRKARSHGSSTLRHVDWVSGAAMLVRREVLPPAGLDEGYRHYCQDLDLCCRARRNGWQVAIEPGFRVLHHQGATSEKVHGSSEAFDPREEILWQDLLRWASRYRSPGWVRAAEASLRAGARLRLAALRLRREMTAAAALSRALESLHAPPIR
jgi:GT2 family glycosyltransferase